MYISISIAGMKYGLAIVQKAKRQSGSALKAHEHLKFRGECCQALAKVRHVGGRLSYDLVVRYA